jgi:hypothetical protein
MAGEGAAMSACVSPAEPDAIERRGDWLVIGGDTTGKRVVCRCSRCHHVTLIGREALEAGLVNCPGCARPATPDARADSFATGVASLESWGAWKRHKGGGGGS